MAKHSRSRSPRPDTHDAAELRAGARVNDDLDDAEDEDAEDDAPGPAELEAIDRAAAPLLFDTPIVTTGKHRGTRISRIGVERLEPSIEEGWLGHLEPTATEATLKTRWGGGKYRITARSATGVILRQRWISIAGEPRFESARARAEYLAMQDPGAVLAATPRTPAAPSTSSAPSLDVMTILQWQAQQAREEAARREREEREREERRRRDDEERERRRAAEQDEREARARREAEEARARDREHMQTMLAMLTQTQQQIAGAGGGSIDALTRGLELGAKLAASGGDGGDDDLGSIVRDMIKGAAIGWKERQEDEDAGAVRVTGRTAEKLREFVGAAQDAGADPDETLTAVLGKLAARAKRAKEQRAKAREKARAKLAAAAKTEPPAAS